MKLQGRILCLTDRADLFRAQLEGTSILAADAKLPELRYGVNTDAMISGAACTLGYTPEILGPHFLVNFHDCVAPEQIAQGGFEVLVAGEAYGSGSSREVAVVAHRGAGIGLVIARSFQRIFQENMVYAGMPMTCDFGVLEALLRQETIDLRALTQELPPLFRAIADAGGLLPYAPTLMQGQASYPLPSHAPDTPMTCIEKICAAKAWLGPSAPIGVPALVAGDQVICQTDFRGMHEYTAGMVMDLYKQAFGTWQVREASSAAAFEDHFVLLDAPQVPPTVKAQRLVPASRLRSQMVEVCDKAQIKIHGPGRSHSPGVCHRVVVESYAKPGDIVVLTDSHTPTAGVLNCFAMGVGSTAMAFALATNAVPVTVPKTVRILVKGHAHPALSPKDLILHIIGDPYFREEQWRSSPTDTCALQFGGPGLHQWNVDELSVLTNMTVEGGMMTGIVEPTPAIEQFLSQQGRPADKSSFVYPDDGAHYQRTIEIDLATVELTVATPGDSRNRVPLSKLQDTHIHNVVIASCTGGSLADLRAAAQVLSGRSLAPGLRLTVTPSSQAVLDKARQEGLVQLFEQLGATVTAPGCGACIGNGPGIPQEGETTASTTNRNFDRRMGAKGPVYLVSPAIAAAAAVTGRLQDPRQL